MTCLPRRPADAASSPPVRAGGLIDDTLQSFQVKNTDLGHMSDSDIVRMVLGKLGGPIEFGATGLNM